MVIATLQLMWAYIIGALPLTMMISKSATATLSNTFELSRPYKEPHEKLHVFVYNIGPENMSKHWGPACYWT